MRRTDILIIGADLHRAMVASAPGRITPHRPTHYEELDLSYNSDMNLHICSQENQQKDCCHQIRTL